MEGQVSQSPVALPPDLRAQIESRLAAARHAGHADWSRPLAEPRVTSSLPYVWACSEFVASACTCDSSLLSTLIEGGRLLDRVDAAWLTERLTTIAGAASSETDLMQALRRFRREQMVRIAWRDLAGWGDLEEVLGDLSALADVCIRFAYDRAYAALSARHGQPRGEETGVVQPLVVLGMGKLGGGELNYSSDIDLVFLFPESGETDGARAIANETFFLRVGQQVIHLLASRTIDGLAYRVDMRLRPFGDSGPLALSFGAFEDYLQQHGRDWERYAYVKARPITGVEYYRALYEEVLRPFVYRRYLDFSVFESLRNMKELMAREVKRDELKDNMKLGPGGIREIEFIAQTFQLLRGGNNRRLQAREICEVLPLLNGQKLLTETAVTELGRAYRFLRQLENRLQEWNDEQTHKLPKAPEVRERLALAMSCADWNALRHELDAHRAAVSRIFLDTVFGPVANDGPHDMVLENLLDIASGAGERHRALLALGVEDPHALIRRIDELRDSTYYRRLDEVGRRRLQQLLPRMLKLVAGVPTQELVWARLLRILEMIGGRTVYLALLNENEIALRRLVELCARSQFLAEQVASHPLLLDELIDRRLLEELPGRSQFERDLAARRAAMHDDDQERQIEMLRQFHCAAIFRVAVADLTGRLPLMAVSDRLTDVAELIVGEALGMAWAHLTERHGRPLCGPDGDHLRPAGMIAVAYGKLGGMEFGYGSDLDLVFLHDSTGDLQRTNGAQSIDNSIFFQRLGQRLVHLLTVHSAAGRLYEVDTRLRPSGKSGLLVQSFSAFQAYQHEDAWTWEHQALLRARAVAGDATLRESFEQVRIEILRTAVRRATLKDEICRMRKRMRAELSKAKSGEFDLKQDAGGIADIEFLCQYWALLWAEQYPQVVIFSSTIRALESLASRALIPQATIDVLVDAYRSYRQRLHHLSLDVGAKVVDASEFEAARKRVTAIWEEVMGRETASIEI